MDFYLYSDDQISLGCFQAFHCDAIMGQMLYQFQGNQRDYFSNDTFRGRSLVSRAVYYECETYPRQWDLRDYWIGILSAGDFLGPTPSYTAIQDPILRLCHRLIAFSIAGRSQAPEKGLIVIAPALPVIDMAELVRLQICVEIDDTWAWVALGPERQPDSAASAPEDAHIVDEGGQAVLAPVQAP
ncbi:hypothetical protein Tco_0117356 [Tanacetum coccineum]